MNNSTTDKLLTAQETAEILGVKLQTLATWRCTKRGGPPFIKVGALIRYRLSEVERWLQRQTITPEPIC